jgi:hypothetical protein
MATILKRKKKDGTFTYRVNIRKKGLPNMNMSFDTEEKARIWAQSTEDAFKEKKNAGTFSINDMLDRYVIEELPNKTTNQQKDEPRHIKFWKEHLGKKIINEVRSLEIEILADSLYDKVSRSTGFCLSVSTRRKFLMTLSYIYNVACLKWKWADVNPVLTVDKHVKKEKSSKQKVKINIVCLEKKSFIEGVKNRMKDLCLHSLEECAFYANMPKSTVKNLLTPHYNSSFFSMATLAKALGLEVKFVIKD